MKSDDNRELVDKLFDGNLSQEEADKISAEILADDKLADEVRFELALRKSFERERDERIDESLNKFTKHPPTRQRNLFPRVLIGLILAAITAALFWWLLTPSYPVSKEEGEKYMRDLILAAQADGRVGVIAGPENDWRTLSLKAAKDTREYPLALAAILSEIGDSDPCESPNLALFAGAIQLYINQLQLLAEPLLRCGETTEDPIVASGTQLPLLIMAIAKQDQAAGLNYWNESRLPLDTLSGSARTTLVKWLDINE